MEWFDATHAHLVGDALKAWSGAVWNLGLLIGALMLVGWILSSTPLFHKRQNKASAKKLGLRHVHSETNFRCKKALAARWLSGKYGADDVDGTEVSAIAEPPTVVVPLSTQDAAKIIDAVKAAGGTVELKAIDPASAPDASADKPTAPGCATDCAPGCTKPAQTDAATRWAKAMASKKPIAVIEIRNDAGANMVDVFADHVDEIIANKDKFSYVINLMDSPGGSVTAYGLMLSEMERLVECSGLFVHTGVKQVAASGGMMQILPSHKISAAPWSILGSIGVVSQQLNYHDLGELIGVKAILMTAGKWKRTVTQWSKPEGQEFDEALAHDKAALAKIHDYFKEAVGKWRPQIASRLDDICTGEHWLAKEVMEKNLGLCDELKTPAQVIFEANQTRDLIYLSQKSKGFKLGMLRFARALVNVVLDCVTDRLQAKSTQFGRLD